jgi:hypothetical protein
MPKFREETFVHGCFSNQHFTLESFPLYGTLHTLHLLPAVVCSLLSVRSTIVARLLELCIWEESTWSVVGVVERCKQY